MDPVESPEVLESIENDRNFNGQRSTESCEWMTCNFGADQCGLYINIEIIDYHTLRVSIIPSTESSFICSRKHDDNCGLGVPALNKVGVA